MVWCKFGFWESGFGTNECWIYKIVVAWKAALDFVTDALQDEPLNMAPSFAEIFPAHPSLVRTSI